VPAGPKPPIPPTFAKLTLTGTLFTHIWRNVAYLALGGSGIATSDLNTLATTINTAWGTRFISTVSNDTTLTEVDLVYVPSVGNEIRGISSVAKVGTAGASTVPNASTCYLLNWNVNKYYRGGHPRWYLPGVITGTVGTGSTIGSGQRTALGTAATGFLNDVNAATTANITSCVLGTLSFQHANAWRVPPVHYPFVSVSASTFLATQRRRIHS
jgi:hypothetical protein